MEIACLIYQQFSCESIKKKGLNMIIVMHKPVMSNQGAPLLLCINASHTISYPIVALFGTPEFNFRGSGYGVAFAESLVGPQS